MILANLPATFRHVFKFLGMKSDSIFTQAIVKTLPPENAKVSLEFRVAPYRRAFHSIRMNPVRLEDVRYSLDDLKYGIRSLHE